MNGMLALAQPREEPVGARDGVLLGDEHAVHVHQPAADLAARHGRIVRMGETSRGARAPRTPRGAWPASAIGASPRVREASSSRRASPGRSRRGPAGRGAPRACAGRLVQEHERGSGGASPGCHPGTSATTRAGAALPPASRSGKHETVKPCGGQRRRDSRAARSGSRPARTGGPPRRCRAAPRPWRARPAGAAARPSPRRRSPSRAPRGRTASACAWRSRPGRGRCSRARRRRRHGRCGPGRCRALPARAAARSSRSAAVSASPSARSVASITTPGARNQSSGSSSMVCAALAGDGGVVVPGRVHVGAVVGAEAREGVDRPALAVAQQLAGTPNIVCDRRRRPPRGRRSSRSVRSTSGSSGGSGEIGAERSMSGKEAPSFGW